LNTEKEKFFPLLRPLPKRAEAWKKIDCHGRVISEKNSLFTVTNISVSSSVPETAGKKIAFFSDLHWNNDRKSEKLLHALLTFLKWEKPDILLTGGDLSGSAEFIPQLKTVLAEISKCVPHTFAVHGNWEEGKTWLSSEFWHKFYDDCNITLLENNCSQCGAFIISGVRDISSGRPKLPQLPDKSLCRILLAHSPDTVIALDKHDLLSPYTIILCGHTHGGQVILPFFGAAYVPGRYGKKFAGGMFQRDNSKTKMFVSRGLNELSFPFRFNCRREVVLLNITEDVSNE